MNEFGRIPKDYEEEVIGLANTALELALRNGNKSDEPRPTTDGFAEVDYVLRVGDRSIEATVLERPDMDDALTPRIPQSVTVNGPDGPIKIRYRSGPNTSNEIRPPIEPGDPNGVVEILSRRVTAVFDANPDALPLNRRPKAPRSRRA